MTLTIPIEQRKTLGLSCEEVISAGLSARCRRVGKLEGTKQKRALLFLKLPVKKTFVARYVKTVLGLLF